MTWSLRAEVAMQRRKLFRESCSIFYPPCAFHLQSGPTFPRNHSIQDVSCVLRLLGWDWHPVHYSASLVSHRG